MEITPELVNLNLEQINYLIDLVSCDIKSEKTNYEEAYDPYQRKGLATKKQCQDHTSKAMQQHAVMQQLYVLAAYSIETEAKMSPSTFGKHGSEKEPPLHDERLREI
tara:strand:+ start:781 stop:1101 length:321 start_codon:yes stop_codon:yes gene_type:complete